MDIPLVSVAMITYNHEPFISEAIEGVLRQKANFKIELVIGEDCSTDRTREIILEYQKKHPHIIYVITSEKNVGMKKNSYRTAKACHGKYMAFCEGDDYWQNPNKLQIQVDYLEGHPECGMVYSDYDVYNVRLKNILKNYIKHNKIEIPDNLSITDIIQGKDGIRTPTVMIRRSLHMQIIEADPDLHYNSHFLEGAIQVWAEAATLMKIHFIPESLATYRVLEISAAHNPDRRKSLRFGKSIVELLLYLCTKYHLSDDIRKNIEHKWCDVMLRIAFYERNAPLALEAKQMKQSFDWKEWLWYGGARNRFIYYICLPLASFMHLIRKNKGTNKWI